MSNRDFVTISTHMFLHDANLAVLRVRLESERIFYAVHDANYASIAPFESLAIGGIKLKVRPGDAPRVQQIMQELSQTKPTPPDEVDPEEAIWIADRLAQERRQQSLIKRALPWVLLGAVLLALLLSVLQARPQPRRALIAPSLLGSLASPTACSLQP